MDDEDAPPPLTALPEQLEALRQGGQRTDLPVASTTVQQGPQAKKAPSLRKGFFAAKPAAKAGAPKASRPAQEQQGSNRDEVPLLRGKKDAIDGGKQIPDFLRVQPDEDQKKYDKVRGELLDALKPTPDMVGKIQQNPDLIAGFEDPEVMAAVNDVAQNPQNIKKYKDNKKVLAFYSAMGGVMGQKLEGMKGQPQSR